MPSKDKAKQAAYQTKHYKQNKQYYADKREVRRIENLRKFNIIKNSLSCAICNESDTVTIDLHHLDPSIKESLVYTKAAHGQSWPNVVKEFEKCVPLCSNCHRKVHAYEEWAKKIDATHLIKVPTFETVD